MKKFKAADKIQDLQFFGEFGEVNPSVSDGVTYTFLQASRMEEVFHNEMEGCYLYSRHWNPNNRYLSIALSRMENTESAFTSGSGMGAISCVIFQICNSGDEIISSRTIYGGTYAFFKNFLPKFNIKTHFVDITKTEVIEKLINKKTKIIFCETLSNPLLEVADIKSIAKIAKRHNLKLVVDNTFTPLIITPANLGADIVVHSLTKFINGTSDTMGGAICSDKSFIDSLSDVNSGAGMLIGPVLDSVRSASILKNMHTLHLRIKQHSKNALFLAKNFQELGLRVIYPGLKSHPQHEIFKKMMNEEFGFGGMLVLDVKRKDIANKLMEDMQNNNIGYLAVSLGFYKTLFSPPASSTSSEIPEEEQNKMGLSEGLIRMSIGLDNDIERTLNKMKICFKKHKLI